MRVRTILAVGFVVVGCNKGGAEVPQKDLIRDARIGCERGDASACFQAGSLAAEEPGGADRALGFLARGCAARHGPSCDGIMLVKGNHEPALVEGCNAGDLLSCSRLADDYKKDPDGAKRARPLRETVCKQSLVLTREISARNVQGMAESCSKLAAMSLNGEGGAADSARALKLDTLGTLLRTEALWRYFAEDDATSQRRLDARAASGVIRDRIDREIDLQDKMRDAFMSSIGSQEREPEASATPLSPVEYLFYGAVSFPAVGASGDDATTCRETGDSIACSTAAARVDKADPSASFDLHVAGCTKRPDQCWSLVSAADVLLKKRDSSRALILLEKGCELKSPAACTRLGVELGEGERGIALDVVKAGKTLDKACSLGSSRACYILATQVEDGRGVGRDPGRVKALRAKAEGFDRPLRGAPGSAADEDACRRAKDAAKCLSAGLGVQDLDGNKAEELFRTGCASSKTTCGLWSFALDRFRKDDASRGMRILEQGCEDGHKLACTALAEVLHLGYRSVARGEPRAAQAYLRACELGDSTGCRASAWRSRGAKDVEKADELRERGLKLDEESVRDDAGDRWAREAASSRARGPSAAELDRARADLRATVDKTKARIQARDQRATAAAAGKKPQPLPPISKDDLDANFARGDVIKKAATAASAR